MVPRRIVAFLLSVVPLFLALLWLWQSQGLDRVYYRVVAWIVDLVYPPFSVARAVQAVGSDADEFVLRLLVNGRNPTLYINAQDICCNVAMTVALYLASAAWQRRFLKWFVGSMVVLLLVHSVTVMTFAQEGLLGNPEVAGTGSQGSKTFWLLSYYNRFYEDLGLHLLVIALWLPYWVGFLRTSARPAPRTTNPGG